MEVVTPLRRTLAAFPNPDALVAILKGMWPVKLPSNKILQFLTGLLADLVVLYGSWGYASAHMYIG